MLDITTSRPPSPWDDARIEGLKRLWSEGYSCSQIAGQLGGGLTRNAVIGKATRIGLPPRKVVHRAPVRHSSKPWRPRHKSILRIDPRIAFDATLEPEAVAPPPEFIGIALLDLEDHHCRFPRGEGAGILFCGQPVVHGESWCASCCAIVYAPPATRRDNSPAPARFGFDHPITALKAFGA